jgi:hypothetical protein
LPKSLTAVGGLTVEQKRELHRYLEESLQSPTSARPEENGHSVLDIAAVHLGPIPKPFAPEDDLLDEMLERRA